MKKVLSFAVAAMILGSSFLCTAQAQKVAVVDVQAVVAKSAQVQALKKEQQTKMQELDKWLKTAQADVQKQQSKESKEKLLKKYNADFAKKKEDIARNYQTKLKEIDKNITATIQSQAKLKGYDMVISKSVVVFGGDDITADVQKYVK